MTKHYQPLTPFQPAMVLDGLRFALRHVPQAQWPTELVAFGQWLKARVAEDDGLSTLRQAQDFVRKNAGDGVRCPCCTQNAKIYRRPLTSEMAGFLVRLVMRFLEVQDWITSTDIPTRGGDYAKLEHWGLIEFEDSAPGKGRRAAGRVRPTKTGAAFALNRQSVPSHVVLFANRRLRMDGNPIFIRDVPNFDYAEVMRACKQEVPQEAVQ